MDSMKRKLSHGFIFIAFLALGLGPIAAQSGGPPTILTGRWQIDRINGGTCGSVVPNRRFTNIVTMEYAQSNATNNRLVLLDYETSPGNTWAKFEGHNNWYYAAPSTYSSFQPERYDPEGYRYVLARVLSPGHILATEVYLQLGGHCGWFALMTWIGPVDKVHATVKNTDPPQRTPYPLELDTLIQDTSENSVDYLIVAGRDGRVTIRLTGDHDALQGTLSDSNGVVIEPTLSAFDKEASTLTEVYTLESPRNIVVDYSVPFEAGKFASSVYHYQIVGRGSYSLVALDGNALDEQMDILRPGSSVSGTIGTGDSLGSPTAMIRMGEIVTGSNAEDKSVDYAFDSGDSMIMGFLTTSGAQVQRITDGQGTVFYIPLEGESPEFRVPPYATLNIANTDAKISTFLFNSTGIFDLRLWVDGAYHLAVLPAIPASVRVDTRGQSSPVEDPSSRGRDLKAGDWVFAFGQDETGDWVLVQTARRQGVWVAKNDLADAEGQPLGELLELSAATLPEIAEGEGESAASSGELACLVSAPNTVNLRGGPGTNFDVVGRLTSGETRGPVGKTRGADGMIWLKFEDGTWVRSDIIIVVEAAGCPSVPEIA